MNKPWGTGRDDGIVLAQIPGNLELVSCQCRGSGNFPSPCHHAVRRPVLARVEGKEENDTVDVQSLETAAEETRASPALRRRRLRSQLAWPFADPLGMPHARHLRLPGPPNRSCISNVSAKSS